MKGIYLYGVTIKDVKIVKETLPKAKGVPFAGPLESYYIRDLQAIISYIQDPTLTERKINQKLKEDFIWTKQAIRQHHLVIARIAELTTIIPFRFATIFTDVANLNKMLEANYIKLKTLLSFFEDKQEWGIKVYFRMEQAKELEKIRQMEIAKLGQHINLTSPGLDWLAEKKADRMMQEKIEEILDSRVREIFASLERLAMSATINQPLPISDEKKGHMLLNGAFLVERRDKQQLMAKIYSMGQDMGRYGISIDITGPWPPYSFVNFDFKKSKYFYETGKTR